MNKWLIGLFALAIGPATALACDTMAHGDTGQAVVMDRAGHDATMAQPSTSAPQAAPATDGEIRKVDVAAQKITVRHGPIENLGMSAMTMVFHVKDPAMLTAVKPGDKVKMTVERIDGVLTILALQRIQ